MVQRTVPPRKLEYAARFNKYLDDFNQVISIGVDNVGSKTIALRRKALRKQGAYVLMGKNTIMRKVLRMRAEKYEESNPKICQNATKMLEMIQGNSGLIFVPNSMDVGKLRTSLTDEKVQTPAKTGVTAPVNVIIQPGPTGQDPSQTSFFQALDIPTKINRGQIEIVSSVQLITKGEKVTRSAAELCVMLNLRPFYYGMKVNHIFQNGEVFSADVLDITQSDIACAFNAGVREVAALCLSLNYPTAASVPHSIMDAYKSMLAVGLACSSYSWENLVKVKEVLADPSKFAAPAAATEAAPTEAAAAVEEEEEEEEESSAAAGGMFGGSESSDGGSDDDSSS